jgi:CMP-N,N'-diacetyllegionaminic acid synthase
MGAWADSGRTAIAIIPARGGSKRVPRKNLRLLGGLPLVVHSIKAALASPGLAEIVVSTDDSDIAALCSDYPITVLERPRELGADNVRNNDVVRHVLGRSAAAHDVVVLLQPTSPFRTGADIDRVLDRMAATGARSAMTITAPDAHPGKFVTLTDGMISPYTNDFEMEAQSQRLPPVYRQNGAVYAVGTEDFLAHDRFYLPPAAAEIMPVERSIDMDTELDFEIGEALIRKGLVLADSSGKSA